MKDVPTLPGLESLVVTTPRLQQHVLRCGPAEGIPVVLLHGNLASALHFEDMLLRLAPLGFRAIAPDLRGFGWSDARPANATRGYRDYVDDVADLVQVLELGSFHLVGWALGGGVALRYLIDHPEQIRSLTLEAPISPYGFGGTVDALGTLSYDDCAGSGGGIVNPDFANRIAAGDRSNDNANSPRNVINEFYYRPPFRAAREEILLTGTLKEQTGPQFYPGDFVPSVNWPNVSPGIWGPMNASSPKYVRDDAAALLEVTPKPPVLWIRGADDQVISDTSLFDPGALGKLGLLAGWPGQSTFPPQPMVTQTRAVLERYARAGGSYREVVFEACGHSPHIEYAARWQDTFVSQAKSDQTGGWLAI